MNGAETTCCNIDKVFAARAIDFDVALAEVMFVTTKCQRSLFVVLEPHQRLAVTSTLLTQAQRHSTAARHRTYSYSESFVKELHTLLFVLQMCGMLFQWIVLIFPAALKRIAQRIDLSMFLLLCYIIYVTCYMLCYMLYVTLYVMLHNRFIIMLLGLCLFLGYYQRHS